MISSIPSPIDGPDCWNSIGIAGDRSCPELETHIHCRNCPVYHRAARKFFDRGAPDGYLEDWTELLASDVARSDTKDLSLLIFRLHQEWLAMATRVIVEVTTPRPVHRIPHRTNDILGGIVNLRGQLQLQVSLKGLIGIDGQGGQGAETSSVTIPRLIVIRRDYQTWVFDVDEVGGVYRFAQSRLNAVPSTLANPANSFSHAVILWRDRSVGYLDETRIFSALKELGQ